MASPELVTGDERDTISVLKELTCSQSSRDGQGNT